MTTTAIATESVEGDDDSGWGLHPHDANDLWDTDAKPDASVAKSAVENLPSAGSREALDNG